MLHPGRRLQKFRRAARLSQEELALRAEVDQAMISLLECGRRRGSREIWRRIAAALGVPAEWFGLADEEMGTVRPDGR